MICFNRSRTNAFAIEPPANEEKISLSHVANLTVCFSAAAAAAATNPSIRIPSP